MALVPRMMSRSVGDTVLSLISPLYPIDADLRYHSDTWRFAQIAAHGGLSLKRNLGELDARSRFILRTIGEARKQLGKVQEAEGNKAFLQCSPFTGRRVFQ